MGLYEWAEPGPLLYPGHLEGDKPRHAPGAPPTPSSTPTPPTPPPRRDTPQRRYLGLTRNSAPRSFWSPPGTRAKEVGPTTQRGSNVEYSSSVPTEHGGCFRRSSAKRISMKHHYI